MIAVSRNNLTLHKNPDNCSAPFPCFHKCFHHCVWNKEFLAELV